MGLQVVHTIFAIMATFRLVDMFMSDRITVGLRVRWPLYVWSCQRCLSVWCGVLATIFFLFVPWLNWPLALSWFYLTKETWRRG